MNHHNAVRKLPFNRSSCSENTNKSFRELLLLSSNLERAIHFLPSAMFTKSRWRKRDRPDFCGGGKVLYFKRKNWSLDAYCQEGNKRLKWKRNLVCEKLEKIGMGEEKTLEKT